MPPIHNIDSESIGGTIHDRASPQPYMNMSGSTVAPEQLQYQHVYASLDSIHQVDMGPGIWGKDTVEAVTHVEAGVNHENSGENSKEFLCELCEQIFKTKKSFRLHCYKFHTRERLLQKSLMAIT